LSVPVQLIAWKDSSPNDLLCIEWDVKPYTLTHTPKPMCGAILAGGSYYHVTNNKMLSEN